MAKELFLSIGDFLNISAILCQEERFDEAMDAAAAALQTEPVKAHVEMAAICYNLGDVEGMERHVNEGLLLDLSYPKLYEARGVLRLGRGDIAGGFDDWKSRTWPRVGRDITKADMPEWDGEDLTGKTCWILQEQGIGDQILWARSLTRFAEKYHPRQLVLVPTPGLERLYQQSFPEARVVNSETEKLPVADSWASLATVQIHLPESVPWSGPYLKALPEDIERIGKCIPRTRRLRVGLCWAGGPGYYIDRDRSFPFSAFAPILKVDGIDFYALQFGFSSNENGDIPDLSMECRDFADTAAALHCLDLLISSDTAIANLAGAIGTSCWVLVRDPIDYRWGMPGERHDWYGDNIRQFRKVIPAVVAEALAQEVSPSMRATPAPIRQRKPITTTCETRYGKMDTFTYGMWCSRSLQLYGEWSEIEMDVMREMLPGNGGVAVEGGSHIGAHTLGLSYCCRRVYAFEPMSAAFALLKKNVEQNNIQNVELYNLGLGAEDDEGKMFPPDFTRPCNPGGCEIHTSDELGGEEVSITTIDGLDLPHVDLIKLDVEGCEFLALRGAEQTIRRDRPVLYVEDNKNEQLEAMYDWLTMLGYRLHRHKVPLRNPNNWRKVPINSFGAMCSEMLLCVPEERADLLQSRYCQGKEGS